MKRKLLLSSFLLTLVFSISGVLGKEINLTYPYEPINESLLILRPYLDSSFLNYLKDNLVYPVIDKDGTPIFYYSENESFGCKGICDNITIRNYTLTSKIFNGTFPNYLNESLILGGNETEEIINSINAIRLSLNNNPQALNDFENYLLENHDYLKSVYFNEKYETVWDYIIEKIKEDNYPLYNSIIMNLNKGDIEESVKLLENYLKENFDINRAYDLSDLYSAFEEGKIGEIQAKEILENILKKLAEERGIRINPEDINKFSELINSPEFKEALEKAMEKIKENPELYDRIQDLAREMMQREEFREMLKNAFKEALKNMDWKTMKEILDIISKMDNKEEIIKEIMESASDYMRQMAEEGKLNEIMNSLESPEIKEMVSEAMKSFSGGILDQIKNLGKTVSSELVYLLAIISIITMLLVLTKLKI